MTTSLPDCLEQPAGTKRKAKAVVRARARATAAVPWRRWMEFMRIPLGKPMNPRPARVPSRPWRSLARFIRSVQENAGLTGCERHVYHPSLTRASPVGERRTFNQSGAIDEPQSLTERARGESPPPASSLAGQAGRIHGGDRRRDAALGRLGRSPSPAFGRPNPAALDLAALARSADRFRTRALRSVADHRREGALPRPGLFNGPLSVYLNACWFRLFGPSLRTLALCNVALLVPFVVLSTESCGVWAAGSPPRRLV